MKKLSTTLFRPSRRSPISALCVLFAAAFFVCPMARATGSEELVELDAELFPVPPEIQPNVEFWTTVYTEYDSHHMLLHDELHMDVVYAVIDFTKLDEAESSAVRRQQKRRQEVRKIEAKYREILNNLAAGKASKKYPEDQERVARLFESVSGGRSKYSQAVRRIRTQTCLQDRFAEGIERSGLYLARIEEIFSSRGLPVELTRLPFVESLFQMRAYSSAAAVGIWQFVRSTGRLYLDMELEYDERYDPLRASEAAAAYLADNLESLKTWPLAITAYNHGAGGMRRAVRTLGTRDLGQIAKRYRSRTFGFASRNFYAEFISAATIYANREHYFPGVAPLPAVEFDFFEPEAYVAVRQLARQASAPLEDLRAMNPALVREVWSEDLYLPAGYRLRVPPGTDSGFQRAYAALPDRVKSPHQVGLRYRVKRGDTLGKIAAKFGTSVSALQRVNKLRSAHLIRQGQTLLIPPGRRSRSSAATTSKSTGARPASHVVRRGETLSQIAERYRTTVRAIKSANRLRGDLIRPSQRLIIP